MFELLEELDGYAGLRNALRLIAERDESWAGIPMPISGHRLTIEPKFPRAEALAKIGVTAEMEERDAAILKDWQGWTLRNRFWSFTRKCRVMIWQDPTGKIEWFWDHHHPLDRLMSMMDLSHAWGIEQEANAVRTLAQLLKHHQFKMYMLTGMFAERSRRSGLLYLFRKLRPTVVIDTKQMNIRCALCMHPIGYYDDTWAGAMTPTDDVIAHLMLMRGDEPMFWRRANQHPAHLPEAGISQ